MTLKNKTLELEYTPHNGDMILYLFPDKLKVAEAIGLWLRFFQNDGTTVLYEYNITERDRTWEEMEKELTTGMDAAWGEPGFAKIVLFSLFQSMGIIEMMIAAQQSQEEDTHDYPEGKTH